MCYRKRGNSNQQTMTTKVIIQDISSILRRSFTAISSLSKQFSSSFSTRTMSSFGRLIRFRDAAGNSRFGEPKISSVSEFDEAVAKGTLEATVFEGSSPFNVTPTSEVVKVQEVLPLLTVKDVPIVKCVGLNYIKHSKVARDISEIMLLTGNFQQFRKVAASLLHTLPFSSSHALPSQATRRISPSQNLPKMTSSTTRVS